MDVICAVCSPIGPRRKFRGPSSRRATCNRSRLRCARRRARFLPSAAKNRRDCIRHGLNVEIGATDFNELKFHPFDDASKAKPADGRGK